MKAIPQQAPTVGTALEWVLQPETAEDFEFMNAVSLNGHRAAVEARWDAVTGKTGGSIPASAWFDFRPGSPRALKAQAGRQALGAIRKLAGLIGRELQAQGHVVVTATDPDAHEQVAARLVELHMVLQSIGDRAWQLEVVIQEMNRHRNNPSSL